MNSFIFKADTIRGYTEDALTIAKMKSKINDELLKASQAGEYWCHYKAPMLASETAIKHLRDSLILSGYKVKVTLDKNGFWLTILWAPEDRKVTFCDGEWDNYEEYQFKD